MAQDPSLRIKYLDWCSAKIAEHIFALDPDGFWLLAQKAAEASRVPAGAGASMAGGDEIVETLVGTGEPAERLRQMILACRKGGRLSMPGVYGGMADKFPIGALMEKGLTVKSGQTHVQKYQKRLLGMIQDGKLDTTFMISHRASLEQGPEMYRHWHDEQNDYTKIVLKPGMAPVEAD